MFIGEKQLVWKGLIILLKLQFLWVCEIWSGNKQICAIKKLCGYIRRASYCNAPLEHTKDVLNSDFWHLMKYLDYLKQDVSNFNLQKIFRSAEIRVTLYDHLYLARHSKWGHNIHTCVRPGIQSEDKSVYNTFKVRTFFHTPLNMPGTYKERITSIPTPPPTPILWQREDSAHSHKAGTEILTSLCQNVLTLNVKNWFWSSLWMPGPNTRKLPPYRKSDICLVQGI